jgi:RNA polymerase sigma-70 factor (ECF subfamily)
MESEPQIIASRRDKDVARQDLEEALSGLARDLLGFLRHHVGDTDVAADLAQDTLAQALDSLHRLRNPAALRGWLYRIAVNRFNDHLRRRGLRAVATESVPERSGQGSSEPESVALTRELDSVLRTELHRLPERQRTVLMLHGIDGVDSTSISELLGISPAAVKMSLFHARERMRERLSRYLGHSLGRKERMR